MLGLTVFVCLTLLVVFWVSTASVINVVMKDEGKEFAFFISAILGVGHLMVTAASGRTVAGVLFGFIGVPVIVVTLIALVLGVWYTVRFLTQKVVEIINIRRGVSGKEEG